MVSQNCGHWRRTGTGITIEDQGRRALTLIIIKPWERADLQVIVLIVSPFLLSQKQVHMSKAW